MLSCLVTKYFYTGDGKEILYEYIFEEIKYQKGKKMTNVMTKPMFLLTYSEKAHTRTHFLKAAACHTNQISFLAYHFLDSKSSNRLK